MTKIKKSYGIICCRKHVDKGLQIILVKKPVTYHYCEFIAGHYRKTDDAFLLKLFNNMTYGEKMDIINMKFAVMWYRVYKNNPEQSFIPGSNINAFQFKRYAKMKAQFEDTFMPDGGVRLRKLINDTCNAETLWEIPKGRKVEHIFEESLNAAIREFEEETLITEDKYKILFCIKPYIETYTDFGTTYQNTYYYADAIDIWEPKIKFANKQLVSEVQDIKWCTLTNVLNMQLDVHTHKRIIKLFKIIGKKYKNFT